MGGSASLAHSLRTDRYMPVEAAKDAANNDGAFGSPFDWGRAKGTKKAHRVVMSRRYLITGKI